MVREIGVTVLRFAVLRRGVIPASRGGKLKTLVQAVAIGLFVLPLSGAWLTRRLGGDVGARSCLTVVTGVDYVVSAVRDSRARPPPACRTRPSCGWSNHSADPGTTRRSPLSCQRLATTSEGEHDDGIAARGDRRRAASCPHSSRAAPCARCRIPPGSASATCRRSSAAARRPPASCSAPSAARWTCRCRGCSPTPATRWPARSTPRSAPRPSRGQHRRDDQGRHPAGRVDGGG